MGGDSVASPKLPSWLPDGWIMKVHRRKDGREDKYYVSPVSGQTFRSKPEVLRYLNVEKVDDLSPATTAHCEEDKDCVNDLPSEATTFSGEDTHCGNGLPHATTARSKGKHHQPHAKTARLKSKHHVDDLPPATTVCSEENKCRVDGPRPSSIARSKEDKHCDVEQVKDSPLWLPSGWILEIRTHKTGAKAGKKYKCYFDPFSGSRFYSKVQVFRYLEAGEKSTLKRKKLTNGEHKEEHFCNSTSNQKDTSAKSEDDILSLVETSPDGLPSGWVKEIKYRKNASGLRKDPYYVDPVSGYVFRSKKDALRYIETGEISKHAFKPKTKATCNKMFSVENESPPPISAKELKGQGDQGSGVRRCLFAGKARKSNRKTTKASDELLMKSSCSPPAIQAFLQCDQVAGPSCKPLSQNVCLKDKQIKAINQTWDHTDLHANGLPDKPLGPAEGEALDQVIEKILDSVSKISPGSSVGELSGPVTENLHSPNVERWEAVGNETLKLAGKILSQSFELVDDPTTSPFKKQEFEGTGAQTTAKRKSTVPAESACNIIKMPSNKNPQEIGDDKKMDLVDQNGKLEPEGKFIEESLLKTNEMSKQVSKKMSRQGNGEEGENSEARGAQPRRSRKSERSAQAPRRVSKRLAGLEADPPADIEVSDKSLKRAKQKSSSTKISLDETRGVEAEPPNPRDKPPTDEADMEEQAGTGRTAREDSNEPITSPFGDSWPDPCIEFAFKTLTGQIPVLDTTIQGYLNERASPFQTPTSDAPHAPASGCLNGGNQSGVQMQLDSAEKNLSSLGTDKAPQSGGRVKILCRRTTRRTPVRGK